MSIEEKFNKANNNFNKANDKILSILKDLISFGDKRRVKVDLLKSYLLLIKDSILKIRDISVDLKIQSSLQEFLLPFVRNTLRIEKKIEKINVEINETRFIELINDIIIGMNINRTIYDNIISILQRQTSDRPPNNFDYELGPIPRGGRAKTYKRKNKGHNRNKRQTKNKK